jgi:hypothetical protein
MPDDRGGEPARRPAGRHAGQPAAEDPDAPAPLGRHRRRLAGTGAMMAGTAAAVIMLSEARFARPARRGPGSGAGDKPSRAAGGRDRDRDRVDRAARARRGRRGEADDV